MQTWKTIDTKTVLHSPPFMTVEMRTVELPNGQRIADWGWLVLPEYVNIVAQDQEGRFVMFRQTKYALGEVTLAIPGGFIEPGEDPLAAAQRELLEEAGYTSDRWIPLGNYVIDANRGAGRAHLFLAMNATCVQARSGGDLEEQELTLMPKPEFETWVDQGQFGTLAWAAIGALALRKIQQEETKP